MGWLNVKQTVGKSLMEVVNKEESFNFRPYFYTSWGIQKTLLFDEQGSEISLMRREKIPLKT